jgi:hypothetical protein
MGIELLPQEILELYEVHEWKHACAVLKGDFPEEWQDMIEVLTQFRCKRSWISVGGGRKSLVSEAIDSALYGRGWAERQFATRVPDELYEIIESCSPGPYLELFARGQRPGWLQWGNQVEDYQPDWPTYANHSQVDKPSIACG